MTYTQKITAFTFKLQESSNSLKGPSSVTSPSKANKSPKKPNLSNTTQSIMMDKNDSVSNQANFHNLIKPIMQEFRLLKDAMSSQKSEISEEIGHLKTIITEQKTEIVSEINSKVESKSMKIGRLIVENTELRKENTELRDHVSKIEISQLSNNIIITGIAEQSFETYEKTKQQIYDTFAAAIQASDPTGTTSALDEAMKVDIVYCSRIGRQKLGKNRPISVTLSRRDDKEKIMGIKSKLPQGIYINNEYPIHIKRARDTLHPIL